MRRRVATEWEAFGFVSRSMKSVKTNEPTNHWAELVFLHIDPIHNIASNEESIKAIYLLSRPVVFFFFFQMLKHLFFFTESKQSTDILSGQTIIIHRLEHAKWKGMEKEKEKKTVNLMEEFSVRIWEFIQWIIVFFYWKLTWTKHRLHFSFSSSYLHYSISMRFFFS